MAPSTRGSARTPRTVAALVDTLDRVKHEFNPEARAAKRQALDALALRQVRRVRTLVRFHEALCYLRAYPDDPALLRSVEEALAGFRGRVMAARAAGGTRAINTLDETGIAATAVRCSLSAPAAAWLARRFPAQAELDWEDPDTQAGFGALLPLVVPAAREETLVEVGIPYRTWLAAAKGRDRRSDLRWVLERLAAGRGRDGIARQALYEALALSIRWELGASPASRTLARVPAGPPFWHRGPLRRWRGPIARRLPGVRVPVRRAGPREADRLLDAARAAVIVRYREVHAFNFADRADVLVAHAGRGVRIVWFGVLPPNRLSLRAHYGYLLLKNGVPMGYGDASLLFGGVEIAYNVFDAFRRGESAFVFVRLLAFLYQRFGVRTFRLDRYQIGHDNEEAVASGAFWFYHKLGFRPTDPALRRLAAVEARRIAQQPAYRSSPATLRRFATSGMFGAAGGARGPRAVGFDVRAVSLRGVASTVVARPGGSVSALGRALAGRGWRRWSRAERTALERLQPILAAIPGLVRWPAQARRALGAAIRAKGARPEADYLRRLRRHRRFRAAIIELSTPP